MHTFQLLECCQWGNMPHQFIHQPASDQLIVDSFEPRRTLRMICAHVVQQTIGVRNESGMHGFLLILKYFDKSVVANPMLDQRLFKRLPAYAGGLCHFRDNLMKKKPSAKSFMAAAGQDPGAISGPKHDRGVSAAARSPLCELVQRFTK